MENLQGADVMSLHLTENKYVIKNEDSQSDQYREHLSLEHPNKKANQIYVNEEHKINKPATI